MWRATRQRSITPTAAALPGRQTPGLMQTAMAAGSCQLVSVGVSWCQFLAGAYMRDRAGLDRLRRLGIDGLQIIGCRSFRGTCPAWPRSSTWPHQDRCRAYRYAGSSVRTTVMPAFWQISSLGIDAGIGLEHSDPCERNDRILNLPSVMKGTRRLSSVTTFLILIGVHLGEVHRDVGAGGMSHQWSDGHSPRSAERSSSVRQQSGCWRRRADIAADGRRRVSPTFVTMGGSVGRSCWMLTAM